MLIAEQLYPNGMTGSSIFNEKLAELVRTKPLHKIIETGTHFGTGTTRALAENCQGGSEIITIEVNPSSWKRAKAANSHHPFVHCWNGLSVDRSQIPTSISWDGIPPHIIVDHLDHNRNKKYYDEVNYPNLPHNLLEKALSHFDYKPDLVVLDSVGHMGTIEFHYLMSRVQGPFLLALDDTTHLKHYQSMEIIRENPDKFTILWEVSYDPAREENKFGSAIVSVHITPV